MTRPDPRRSLDRAFGQTLDSRRSRWWSDWVGRWLPAVGTPLIFAAFCAAQQTNSTAQELPASLNALVATRTVETSNLPRESAGNPLDESAVTQAIADLGAVEFETRQAAQQHLISLGPAAVPALIQHLSDASDLEQVWRVREALVAIAIDTNDSETFSKIREGLCQQQGSFRQEMAEAGARLGVNFRSLRNQRAVDRLQLLGASMVVSQNALPGDRFGFQELFIAPQVVRVQQRGFNLEVKQVIQIPQIDVIEIPGADWGNQALPDQIRIVEREVAVDGAIEIEAWGAPVQPAAEIPGAEMDLAEAMQLADDIVRDQQRPDPFEGVPPLGPGIELNFPLLPEIPGGVLPEFHVELDGDIAPERIAADLAAPPLLPGELPPARIDLIQEIFGGVPPAPPMPIEVPQIDPAQLEIFVEQGLGRTRPLNDPVDAAPIQEMLESETPSPDIPSLHDSASNEASNDRDVDVSGEVSEDDGLFDPTTGVRTLNHVMGEPSEAVGQFILKQVVQPAIANFEVGQRDAPGPWMVADQLFIGGVHLVGEASGNVDGGSTDVVLPIHGPGPLNDNLEYAAVQTPGMTSWNAELSRTAVFDENWRGEKADWDLLSSVDRLTYVQINGRELDETTFKALQNCPALTNLALNRCQLDLKAIESFLETRPEVTITATGPARMGIYGATEQDGQGCLIGEVLADSPAEVAGIRPGDRIEMIDGIKTPDFSRLALFVAMKQPGDVLELQVQRQGKRVLFDLKLEVRE